MMKRRDGPVGLQRLGAMATAVDLRFQIISRNVRSTTSLGLAFFQGQDEIHGNQEPKSG